MAKEKQKMLWDGLHMMESAESRDYKNNYFIYYKMRIKSLAQACFEWTNLPETVDQRILEQILYNYGVGVFYKDPILGFQVLWTSLGSDLDVKMLPTKYEAYGMNGYTCKLTNKDSVLMFDNNLLMPGNYPINMYANRLAELDVSIDVNLTSQRYPLIVKTTDNEKLALENFMMAVRKGNPVVFVTDNFKMDSIQSIDTKSPYLLDKLQKAKQHFWGDVLAFLGIDTFNYEKGERVQSAEVEAMNDFVKVSRQSRLMMREQACEMINEMFGLNIGVRWRSPSIEEIELERSVEDVVDIQSDANRPSV